MSYQTELPAGAKVRARVLVSGAHGKVDDVIEVEAAQLSALTGVVDAHPAAVAYAESLATASDAVPPSLLEVMAASAALQQREQELDDRAERLDLQARDNQAESERLQHLATNLASEGERLSAAAAKLEHDQATFEAAKAAAAAPSAGKGKASAGA